MTTKFKFDAKQEVLKVIDHLTDPNRQPVAMTRDEYKDFLGELIADLRIQLEAAEQEDS